MSLAVQTQYQPAAWVTSKAKLKVLEQDMIWESKLILSYTFSLIGSERKLPRRIN
jgi:hypothetical protein